MILYKNKQEEKPPPSNPKMMKVIKGQTAVEIHSEGHSIAEATKEHQVSQQMVTPDMGTVGLTLGMVVNLGNYSTARVEVSLTLPSLAHDIEDTFIHVRNWCESKMEGLLDDINEVKAGKISKKETVS